MISMPLIFMVAAIVALVGAFRGVGPATQAFQVLVAIFMVALAACATWGAAALAWANSLSFEYPDDPIHVLLSRIFGVVIRLGTFLSSGIPGKLIAALGVVVSLSMEIAGRVARNPQG
jgi:hypothetical protein